MRRWLQLVLAGATMSAALSTHAQSSKTKQLAGTLRKDPDHRVRIDAALKLGTSDDPDGVQPLCACLSDVSETELVRVACAAALGKLNKPGRNECLTKNANDSSAKVKAQVAAAQKVAGPVSTATSAPPIVCSGAPGPGVAKYYVGVVVTNKTKRADAELVPLVRQEFGCKLRSYGRFRLATDTDAKAIGAVVAKEKLQGYLVTLTVEPTKSEGKTVRVAMKLLVTTHTGDLKGELSKQLAIAGALTPALEDELLRTGATSLAEDFAAGKP